MDYQMIEDEDEQGLTRLFLVISPRIEIEDETAVIEAVLEALRRSSAMADAARVLWEQAQMIRIKRIEPVWTGRGKLLPLQMRRAALSQLGTKNEQWIEKEDSE